MWTAIGKFFLNFLWGKVLKEGIPLFAEWLAKHLKKQKIKNEVKSELKDLKELQKEAREWLKENGNEPLPKDLEDRLRDAARRRRDGLQR